MLWPSANNHIVLPLEKIIMPVRAYFLTYLVLEIKMSIDWYVDEQCAGICYVV